MGTTYSIDQLVFNGSDYDKLNPTTTPTEIIGIMPIDKGGTGSNNSGQALTNLGGAARTYVDETFLSRAGGQMGGGIQMDGNAISNVSIFNGSLSNFLSANGQNIKNLGDAYSPYDAVNLRSVNKVLKFKLPSSFQRYIEGGTIF